MHQQAVIKSGRLVPIYLAFTTFLFSGIVELFRGTEKHFEKKMDVDEVRKFVVIFENIPTYFK